MAFKKYQGYFQTEPEIETDKYYFSKMSDVDQWIEVAKQCKYLPENDLKVMIELFFLMNSIDLLLLIYLNCSM